MAELGGVPVGEAASCAFNSSIICVFCASSCWVRSMRAALASAMISSSLLAANGESLHVFLDEPKKLAQPFLGRPGGDAFAGDGSGIGFDGTFGVIGIGFRKPHPEVGVVVARVTFSRLLEMEDCVLQIRVLGSLIVRSAGSSEAVQVGPTDGIVGVGPQLKFLPDPLLRRGPRPAFPGSP